MIDEVMAELTTWQNRPLEPLYTVPLCDALRIKIREDVVVRIEQKNGELAAQAGHLSAVEQPGRHWELTTWSPQFAAKRG